MRPRTRKRGHQDGTDERAVGSKRMRAEAAADPHPSGRSAVFDTYPTRFKRDCKHKARSNEIFGDLCRNVDAGHCLVLDAASCLTTKLLVSLGRRRGQIHVPNFCDDAYEEIKKSGLCMAYHCTLHELLRRPIQIKSFGAVYLDYCCTLKGGFSKSGTSPAEDIRLLFRKKLLSRRGCVLAVTLCKPRDDSLRSQIDELRWLVTSLGVCNSLSVVTYMQSNWYDNWATEFFVIGKAAAVKRVLRLDREGLDQATAASERRKANQPIVIGDEAKQGESEKEEGELSDREAGGGLYVNGSATECVWNEIHKLIGGSAEVIDLTLS